jgi:hypothetical protein
VRVGVMVGPERGDTARQVARMLDDIAWAEAAGLASAWIPQIPNDMDALLCVALLGAHTRRIELLPIGAGRDELIASKHRTREVLAGIAADLR